MLHQAICLLTKKLSGEASASELELLNHLLSQHPHLHQQLGEYEAYWNAGQLQTDVVGNEEWMEAHWQRMRQPPLQPLPVRNTGKYGPVWPWLGGLAAILLLALFWFYARPTATHAQPNAETRLVANEVTTRPGSRTRLVLPDGTQAWLNADSRLTYAPDFNKTSRKVQLDGEAYFIVAKNRARPFYIETSQLDIKVTGTTFNVKAYAADGRTETSIVEGSVEVSVRNRPGEVYLLRPAEKLVLDAGIVPDKPNVRQAGIRQQLPQPVVTKLPFDAAESLSPETAWVHNVLAFSDESFRQVADKMERWYNVEISFGHQNLEDIRFTGTFANETVEQALQALQLTTPFVYRVSGNEIIIISK